MPLPVGVEGSMFLACPSICDYCWRDISTTSGWIFVGLIWNFHYNQQIQIKVRARSVVWNIFFIFSSYLLVCHTEMLLAHSCSKTQGPFFFFFGYLRVLTSVHPCICSSFVTMTVIINFTVSLKIKNKSERTCFSSSRELQEIQVRLPSSCLGECSDIP